MTLCQKVSKESWMSSPRPVSCCVVAFSSSHTLQNTQLPFPFPDLSPAMAACPVCLELFNTRDRIPHVLLCGHEYCAACLGTLLEGGTIVCPQDRAKTRTGSVASLPRGPSFSLPLALGPRASCARRRSTCGPRTTARTASSTM